MGRRVQYKWPINKKPIKKKVVLTNEQKADIRRMAGPNVRIITIAEKLKIEWQNVYFLVVKENLQIKMDGNAVKRKEAKSKPAKNIFDVHEKVGYKL